MSIRLEGNRWTVYQPSQKIGKLCYHYCSKQSYLPIRDVLNDHGEGFKVEPNYETASYNWYASCNCPSVHAAVTDGLSHILFITKYTGTNNDYTGRYFIVGFFEVGWKTKIEGRYAVRAKRMCFVSIEHAYEVTPRRWQRINKYGTTQRLENLRWATQRVNGDLLNEILCHLEDYDATDAYLREVARLKAEYNPFEQVPTGHIFIINVGANISSPLQSPLFDDGRFEFVPIPEDNTQDSDESLAYADLKQFNAPNKPLLQLFGRLSVPPQKKVHYDPEFATWTFGDNVKKKSNLQDLQVGDFLFFLARLVPYDGRQFNHHKAIFALIGYLEIADRLDDPDNPLFTSPSFVRNAHVRRWKVDPSSFDSFAIFKGSANSRRFRYATPFNRQFVERVPILKVNGSEWGWGQTTDLGVIGSHTRMVRMHIDPGSTEGPERAERFWQHIWARQEWQKTGEVQCSECGVKR
jgi:hypothetical protein